MSDPGKVIVALGFFSSIVYIVRLLVTRASWPTVGGAPGSAGVKIDDERLTRLEQAVESIALEVERISEGQRFTTRLLTERTSAERAPASSREPRQVTPH